MSLNSVHIQEKVAQRKPLYFHILCSAQVSLFVNLGTTFFPNTLTKFCALSAKLAALTSCGVFSLVASGNSVNLW